jgi:hypothetical protein
MNPLQSARHRRRAEKIYRDGGWGPELSWEVAREGEKPLIFQMRMPLEFELIDVGALAAQAQGAPELVAKGAIALKDAARESGTIVVGAMCRQPQPGDTGRDVLGTITVALRELPGAPPTETPADPENPPNPEVRKISDRAWRIKELTVAPIEQGAEAVAMLSLQYLITTRYGALAMTLATANPVMIRPSGREAFEKIVTTGWIGEGPRQY